MLVHLLAHNICNKNKGTKKLSDVLDVLIIKKEFNLSVSLFVLQSLFTFVFLKIHALLTKTIIKMKKIHY